MHDEAMARLRAANPVAGTPTIVPVDELIAGWGERAAAGPAAKPRARWRSSLLSIVIALVAGTGSAAVALAAFTGSPFPHGADTITVHPAAGTTHLSTPRASDPDGGPAWALRLGTAPGGLQCWGVGQVQDGQLGLVGLDGRFRVVPPAGADDCGVPPGALAATVQTRTFIGRTRDRSVTVIYGVRGRELGGVRVRYVDGMTASLPVGADGGFIVARRGSLTQQRPRIEIDTPTGPPKIVDFGLPVRAAATTPTSPLVPSEAVR